MSEGSKVEWVECRFGTIIRKTGVRERVIVFMTGN